MRTFLPTATTSVDGYALIGDSEAHLCVDEGVDTPDDVTTYVESTKDGATTVVQIAAVSPSPALYSNHKLRFRARRSSATGVDAPVLGASLLCNGSLIYSSPDVTPTGTWTTYEYDLGLSSHLSDYSLITIRLEDRGTALARRVWFSTTDFQVGSEVGISGSGAASFSGSGTLLGSAGATGSANTSLSGSALMIGLGVSLGSCAFAASASGSGSGLVIATGSAALSFAAGSPIPLLLGMMTGAAGLEVAASSPTLSGSASLSGAALLSFSGLGSLGGIGFIRNLFGVVRHQFELAAACQVVHDNEPNLDDSATRLRLSIDSVGLRLLGWSNGSLLLRYEGTAAFEISAAVDGGEKTILDTYNEVWSAMAEKTLGGIRYRSPRIVAKHRDVSRWTLEGALDFETDTSEPKLANSSGRPLIDQAASALRTRYRTSVATPLALQVLSDNEPMSVELQDKWSRFSWKVTDSTRVDQVTVRNRGVAEARLFCRADSGDSQLLDAVQSFLDNMKCVTIAGVTLSSPSIRTVGRRGSWWQLNVSCPFFFDTAVS
ncbi:hypothetical protein [Caudoviricetes sp.]|nr:hypothetical protein [Caudoviricetes sp.]UOF82744.1 hypothetical protein [Caudoviricetes sp.]